MLRTPVVVLSMLICFACSKKSAVPEKSLFMNEGGGAEKAGACPGKTFPLQYRLIQVDYPGLRKLLLENDAVSGAHDTLDIALPMPDGTSKMFSIFPVHVMPDELSQKYPGLATYSGKNPASPAETVRLDISPAGFRAMVMSPYGTVLIDPYCPGDSIHVISYYKKNMPEGSKAPFEEVIPGDHQR
jgi:hypothetical protein